MSSAPSRRFLGPVVFAVFTLPGVLMVAMGQGSASSRHSVVRQADVAAGRVLYESRCASCHGDAGGGTGQGPPIAGLGAAAYDFMLSTGRMPLDRPVTQARRKSPSFDRRQIGQLVAFLTQLPPGDGTPIPDVDPAAGDLAAGQELYQRNCAACHGATGLGGAVGNVTAPSLYVATSVEIGEAVRFGPGVMPVFDARTISDTDLNSVVRYVEYLRRPDDRGGAGLGHVGPIVEGFVALVAGLGALVVVTRLIGSRS